MAAQVSFQPDHRTNEYDEDNHRRYSGYHSPLWGTELEYRVGRDSKKYGYGDDFLVYIHGESWLKQPHTTEGRYFDKRQVACKAPDRV